MKQVFVLATAFCLSANVTKADMFGGFLDGAIGGAIVGGIIDGSDGAWDGAVVGGAIGAIDGAYREGSRQRYYPRNRDSYIYSNPRRPAPSSQGQAMSSRQLVLEIQQSLRRLGYNPGPADGVAGPATGRAIQAYKRDQGLPQDNVINTSLLNHMRQRGG